MTRWWPPDVPWSSSRDWIEYEVVAETVRRDLLPLTERLKANLLRFPLS